MEHDRALELSLQQEFNLKAFEYQIQPIDIEQSKELLVELYRQLYHVRLKAYDINYAEILEYNNSDNFIS